MDEGLLHPLWVKEVHRKPKTSGESGDYRLVLTAYSLLCVLQRFFMIFFITDQRKYKKNEK